MSCACNLRRCHTGRLNISLRTRRWELREEKKRICLILQSDSSQQISQSQCHSIMNSPPVFQAFCCHAAVCIFFFSTTECEMCFELQQGVRVSTSFSLLFSLSLCLLSGYRYHFPSFFLSSIPSLHLPPPTKPVTPPPHHTLFTRTSASTLCRVRAGDEGGSGRF